MAALALLRKRFGKVGVLGHSEGGTIALMLAAEGKADFIVSLAEMAVSGEGNAYRSESAYAVVNGNFARNGGFLLQGFEECFRTNCCR